MTPTVFLLICYPKLDIIAFQFVYFIVLQCYFHLEIEDFEN